MQKKIRLKDVAAKAGVAVNTASTILNQRSNSWASKETEARVFQAAKELGYRPSKTARALQSGRYQSIGLLIQDLTNPFFATIADEHEAAVEESGYDLLVENARSSTVRETRLLAHLADLEVDGSIVYLSDTEAYRHELAAKHARGEAVVAVGNGVPETPMPVDAIFSDFTDGLTAAIGELHGLGHRRFAFLEALAEGTASGSRPALFAKILADHGVPAADTDIIPCGPAIDSAHKAFAAFLDRPPESRPTALVAMNDLSALGAMRAAIDAGLRVPADLSIVGVDDIPLAAFLPVSLSSIRQRYRQIARAATDLLLNRLEPENAASDPEQIIIPTLFIPRESTGPAPTR